MPDPAEGFFSGNRLRRSYRKKKLNIKFYLLNISIMLPDWFMILPPIAHPIRSLYWEAMVLLNEVIDGIVYLDKVTLGYIPLGSGNDFARGLGLPTDIHGALEQILPQRITPP